MSRRDLQRYRKTYSYYRTQPVLENSFMGGAEGEGVCCIFTTSSLQAYSQFSVSFDVNGQFSSFYGDDTWFYVSGGEGQKAVFGGDVVVSGSLDVSGDVLEVTGSLIVSSSSSLTGNAASLFAVGAQIYGVSVNVSDAFTQVWRAPDHTTYRMIIDGNGGGVGIGTNSVQNTRFYVSSSLTGNAASTFTVGSLVYGVSVNASDAFTHVWRAPDHSTYRMIIDGNGGGVGIGDINSVSSNRLFVTGSNSLSETTAVIKRGAAESSSGAGILDVQNSSGTSLLFVSGSGGVGIGTNNPLAQLHVTKNYGGSLHEVKVGEPNVFGVATNTYTSFQHTFLGGDGTTQRLVLDSNGKALLGGTLGFVPNPDKLTIVSITDTANQDGGIRLTDPNLAINARIALKTDSGTAVRLSIEAPSSDDGSFQEAISIVGGQVGIGTTGPTDFFHVYDQYGDSTMTVQSTLTTSKSAIKFLTNGVNWELGAHGNDAGNNFYLLDSSTPAYRVVVNSSGKVGIGTTEPHQKLGIGGTTWTSTSTPDAISLGATYSNTAGTNLKLRLFDDNAGTVNGFGVSNGKMEYSVMSGISNVWYIGGVQKMMLDSSGILWTNSILPNADNTYVLGLSWLGNLAWAAVYAYSYPSLSDYRTKKNITSITGSLERLVSLNPVTYEYSDYVKDPEKLGTRSGFIAHEMQEVFPSLVSGSKDAVSEDGSMIPQTICQDDLIPYIVDAIKQLKTENETLKQEIEILKSKMPS